MARRKRVKVKAKAKVKPKRNIRNTWSEKVIVTVSNTNKNE